MHTPLHLLFKIFKYNSHFKKFSNIISTFLSVILLENMQFNYKKREFSVIFFFKIKHFYFYLNQDIFIWKKAITIPQQSIVTVFAITRVSR